MVTHSASRQAVLPQEASAVEEAASEGTAGWAGLPELSSGCFYELHVLWLTRTFLESSRSLWSITQGANSSASAKGWEQPCWGKGCKQGTELFVQIWWSLRASFIPDELPALILILKVLVSKPELPLWLPAVAHLAGREFGPSFGSGSRKALTLKWF